MLSPGEAVIPAGMTSKYRPLIQGMISGTLPGYQKGGIIGDTYRIGPTDRVSRDQIENAIRVIAKPPFVGNNVNYELNEALAVIADIQQQAALARADVYRRQEISDIDKIVDSQGLKSKFESGLPGRGGSEQLDNYRRTISETIYDKASEGKPGSEVYGFLKAPVLPFDISEIIPIINSVGLELGVDPAEIQQKILSQLERSNESILKNPAVGGYGEVDLKFNKDAMIASNAQAIIGDTLSSSTDDLLKYNARMAAIKAMPVAKLLSGDYTDEELTAMFGPSNVPGFYEVAIPQSAATLENIDLATLIETNKDVIYTADTSQSTITANKTNTSRTASWSGIVDHIATVTFASADVRRHFFNAGGEIRFTADLDPASSNGKNNDWNSLLANMGTVLFKSENCTSVGSSPGTSYNIGNFDMTATDQLVFQKDGTGVYTENDYNIKAKELNSTTIQFTIQFRDDDVGDDTNNDGAFNPQDESVTGTLQSVVGERLPTGSRVSLTSPTFNTTNTL